MTEQSTTIRPALQSLEAIYRHCLDWANALRVDLSDIPEPIIIIQTSGRKRALGWLAAKRWANREVRQPIVNELSISSEYLARPMLDICATMLHETAHHVNATRGIKDCSSGQYHNKRFKETAEALGLSVSKQRGRGFASTELGETAAQYFLSLNLDDSPFSLFRTLETKTKAPTKMRKWVCSEDCTIVRCATNLNARCETCGELFTREA